MRLKMVQNLCKPYIIHFYERFATLESFWKSNNYGEEREREKKKWTPKDREGRPHEHTSSQRMSGLTCIQAIMANCNQVKGDGAIALLYVSFTQDFLCIAARTHTHTHTHRLNDNSDKTRVAHGKHKHTVHHQISLPTHRSDIEQTINTNPISFDTWINGNW